MSPGCLPSALQALSNDPLLLGRILWPQVSFFDRQRDVIKSVYENDQTFVIAANKVGKDFIAGFIIVTAFLTRYPCRIVTTSAKEDHLRVLWGEIGWFIQNCRFALDIKSGGPLIINSQEIKRIYQGKLCQISYIKGMVASEQTIAAMGGHHADPKVPDNKWHTLFVADEASSVPTSYYDKATPWAQRVLAFGNSWPCDNFFKWAVEGNPSTNDGGGNVPRQAPQTGYYRKVEHIEVTDSPNVRLGIAERAMGIAPTYRTVIPGCKPYNEYERDQVTRDEEWLCVAHHARFWKGASLLLFPPEWLNRAGRLALLLQELTGTGRLKRIAKSIGIDPAEGGDKTSMCAVDEYGIIELVSRKTPNTMDVVREAIAFMRKHNVKAESTAFDRGGGGYQHANYLREQGYNVRTVAFGESLILAPQRAKRLFKQRQQVYEGKYVYVNRRAEMYWELSQHVDPIHLQQIPFFARSTSAKHTDGVALGGWSIPTFFSGVECHKHGGNCLRMQLSAMTKLYDKEGRCRMLPKNRVGKKETASEKSEKTLVELIGHSPDEADAIALALHVMLHKSIRTTAGVA
jgi:hypothetical protein